MPDTRSLIVLGLFILTGLIFGMIAWDPKIADVQLFGVLATAVISGSFGSAIGYFFGSSKTPDGTTFTTKEDTK